jgi:hypothetical protein
LLDWQLQKKFKLGHHRTQLHLLPFGKNQRGRQRASQKFAKAVRLKLEVIVHSIIT